MGTQVDSIAITNKSIQKNLLSSPRKSEKTNPFEPKLENQVVGDTISFTESKTDAKKTEEKKSKTKKWLIAAGIAIGTIAVSAVVVYFLKNKTPKIAGDTIEKFQHFDDFNVFKDLKMCKALSLEEKKKAFELLHKNGNKDIFLATLTGDKPMAYLAETVKSGDSAFSILKKLKLGNNFEWVSAPDNSYGDIRGYGEYFINKSKIQEVIKTRQDIFINGLGLPSGTSTKKIYEVLFDTVRKNKGNMANDLLGLALGFPQYDTLIYNLENLGNLRAYRTSQDFIPRLLDVLKSEKSPYKNLSKNRLEALTKAIKNINQKNLENIAIKGSYHDGLYEFINFCDDTEELERIANATSNYKHFLGLT